MSLDQRVPVKLIHEYGTATVEEQSGRRSQWAAEKLLPPECYLCTGAPGFDSPLLRQIQARVFLGEQVASKPTAWGSNPHSRASLRKVSKTAAPKGTEGAFQILAYGSTGRLRCVHAGPCPEPRARRSWLDACTRNANPAPAYVCVHCGVHVDPHHHTQTECAAERDKE